MNVVCGLFGRDIWQTDAKPPAGLLILTKAIVHSCFVQTSVHMSAWTWLNRPLEPEEFIQTKVNVLFVDLSSFGMAQQVCLIAPNFKHVIFPIWLPTKDALSLKNENRTITNNSQRSDSYSEISQAVKIQIGRCCFDAVTFSIKVHERRNCVLRITRKKWCVFPIRTTVMRCLLHVRLCVLGFKRMIRVRDLCFTQWGNVSIS